MFKKPKESLFIQRFFLRSVDLSDYPFNDGKGSVLCHGDLCLPNIFAGNRGITGFIDLGNCHVGNMDEDVQDCLWSLEANLTGEYSDGVEKEPLDNEAFLRLLEQ